MNQTQYNSAVFSPMSNPRQFTDEVEDFLHSLDYDMEECDFQEVTAEVSDDLQVTEARDEEPVGDGNFQEEAAQVDAIEQREDDLLYYDLNQIDISYLEEPEMDNDLQVTEARDEEPAGDGNFQEEAAQVDAIEQREDDLLDYDLNQIDISCLEEHEMDGDIQVTEAQDEEPDLPMEVDEIELAMSCFKRKPEEEQMSVGQEHQATGSQVEEQYPQTSFINEPWIQVSQDDYNQAPTYYQYPPNPQSPVQSYRSESLEPRMAQQQMDEHEFSRACFDLYLTSNYSNKFSVYQDARKLLARYKWLFDVLPKEKREFLEEEIFQNFYVAKQSTKPPKRPSKNPFYSLLKKFDVDTFGQLFEKIKTKIDEPRMRQILWDFYDYYHVKQNPYH